MRISDLTLNLIRRKDSMEKRLERYRNSEREAWDRYYRVSRTLVRLIHDLTDKALKDPTPVGVERAFESITEVVHGLECRANSNSWDTSCKKQKKKSA